MKTLLVFTGGGLAPALNPTLYGITTTARKLGWRVLGGLHGWSALLPGGKHIELTNLSVEILKKRGGTLLRSSRTNPFVSPNRPEDIIKQLEMLRVDAVIAIGGDDTLSAAGKLANLRINIIGIPKTIDNDLKETDYTPGFPTAAHRLIEYTRAIKDDAAYALSRIYVIEAMGFKAGWLTCASVFGGADLVLPPEWELSWRTFKAVLKKRYQTNGNYGVVVASHGAYFDEALEAETETQRADQYGHARPIYLCLPLAKKIQEELGVETKPLYPGNYLEAGDPIPFDRDLAIALGGHAAELVSSGTFGVMVTLRRDEGTPPRLVVSTAPLQALIQESHRPLPKEMYDQSAFLPTDKFRDYLNPLGFNSLSEKPADPYSALMKLASR